MMNTMNATALIRIRSNAAALNAAYSYGGGSTAASAAHRHRHHPSDVDARIALLWIAVFAMLYGIYRIIRSKARGDTDWGDSPGL